MKIRFVSFPFVSVTEVMSSIARRVEFFLSMIKTRKNDGDEQTSDEDFLFQIFKEKIRFEENLFFLLEMNIFLP